MPRITIRDSEGVDHEVSPEQEERSKKLYETLEEALVAGSKELVSEPLELKFPHGTVNVRMRKVPDFEKQLLRVEAMKWVEHIRRLAEGRMKDDEIRDASMDWAELRSTRWDMLITHAAMRDVDDPTKEAISLRTLEQHQSSPLRNYLSAKYYDYEEGFDLDDVTNEDVATVIEILKKKALPISELWERCGFATLAVCLHTMAAQLEKLETPQS